jgi:hypothetical protein
MRPVELGATIGASWILLEGNGVEVEVLGALVL